MYVTVLVDDYCGGSKLLGEHGLSMFIETPRGRLLFDTGRGEALYPNANAMGIPIGNVDGIVLSHGHFDHTWGLPEILRREGNLPVWASPLFDMPRYSVTGGKKFMAGSLLRKENLDFHPVEECSKIIEGVQAFTVPCRLRDSKFVPSTPDLIAVKGDLFQEDSMEDDLSLLLHGTNGYSVILGCAHAGVVNIMERAAALCKTREFYTVMGGMHFRGQSREFLERSAHELSTRFSVKLWRPCHCTGFKAAFILGETLNNVDWAPAGFSLEI